MIHAMVKISLKMCCGMNCLTHGGQELLDFVEANPQITTHYQVESVECQNTCGDRGVLSPVVEIDGIVHSQMTPERLMELLEAKIAPPAH